MGSQTSTSHLIMMIRVLFLIFFLSFFLSSAIRFGERKCRTDEECAISNPITRYIARSLRTYTIGVCYRYREGLGLAITYCAECLEDVDCSDYEFCTRDYKCRPRRRSG